MVGVPSEGTLGSLLTLGDALKPLIGQFVALGIESLQFFVGCDVVVAGPARITLRLVFNEGS